MAATTPDTARKAVIDELLLDIPGVVAGKMFGYPAYYINGRLFACIFKEGVGLKVPEEAAGRLLTKKHIVPFQPMGRPKMREWIQINRLRPADFRKDIDIFRASFEFVKGLKSERKGKR